MAPRPKIGDLYEVPIAKGFGYFQYCFYEGGDPRGSYGYLLRVIEGLHQTAADPAVVATGPTLFWTYFCLGAALHHRLVKYVANVPIPRHSAAYPMMRTCHGTDDGLVLDWLILGSGENQKSEVLRQVQVLSDAEQKLSEAGIISFPDLQEMIEEQYRPESDPGMLRAQRHWTEVARREKEIGAVADSDAASEAGPNEGN